jgi:hypothetical protein
MGGHDFYYERITLSDKGGAAVFAIKDVIDAKEFDLYWVVVPLKYYDWEKGCDSPDKGHVVCMCKDICDAKMVASAINIAHHISFKVDLDGVIKSMLKPLGDTYDTDAMTKEIHSLRREGKSDDEIIEVMKNKRESFRRKNPTETKKNGGEW